jgi:very-short-patch-repair endonuclease
MKKLKMKCNICGKLFSISGIACHMAKIHKVMDGGKAYYNEVVGQTYCLRCGKQTRFVNISKGYLKFCPTCTIHDLKHFTLLYGEKEGLVKYSEYVEKHRNNSSKMWKNRSDYEKQKNNPSYELFWIIKGYTINEAKKKISEHLREMNEKFVKNIAQYKGRTPLEVDYWVKKGFSKEDAIKQVSNRQKTFSLDICVEKFGEEIGLSVWEERQKKWLKTMNEKSDEEKLDINIRKIITLKSCVNKYGQEKGTIFYNNWAKLFRGVSKSSQQMCWDIYNKLTPDIQKLCFFDSFRGEYRIGRYLIDFYIDDIKFAIEYNGDYWHANPEKFKDTDYISILKHKIFAKDIWKRDGLKYSYLKTNDINYKIIWESDYKKNKENILKEIVDVITELYNKRGVNVV